MNAKAKGYVLGAVAAATYGMNPLFALPLYGAGMDPDSVLFFRYLFAIPLLGVMLRVRGRGFGVPRGTWPVLVAMGLLVAFSSLGLFLSYNYMDAGIASTLLFVYPVMVALIMAVVCRERPTVRTLLCIGAVSAGIGLLYDGGDGTTLSLVGVLLVFVSSLSYAVYIVAVNRTALRDMATLKVTFYVLLFGLVLFVVRLWTGDGVRMPDRWYLWGNLLALAVFPTAVSFLCTTGAIRYIGSTPTAILGALEPVTAVFFGIVVFGETLTLREGIGLATIVAAVTGVIAGDRMTVWLIRLRKLFPRLSAGKRKAGDECDPK